MLWLQRCIEGNRGNASIVSVFIGLILALHGTASQAEICTKKIYEPKGEWAEHRQDVFIVKYTLSGQHALQSSADSTSTGVPDVVADAATQLVAMRKMLKVLGFRLPIESPRYRGQGVSHILVRFRDMQHINGRAFDEVRRLPTGECVLIIEITSKYRSGNLTPAHELFHQVQNGYTPFKRPWFYEGTARWSETILGKPVIAPRTPPVNEAGLQALWSQSYSAVSVWYGLIERCGYQTGVVEVPEHLRALRYRDGQPVVLDHSIPGHGYIRQVLQSLEKLAEKITNDQGLIPYRWPEKAQRDHRYDAAIWNVVCTTEKCGVFARP